MKEQEPRPLICREKAIREYYKDEHMKIVSKLEKYGLSSIRAFRVENWYLGDDCEGAVRRYYLAEYHNKLCFVKLAIKDSTIQNEIYINNYLTENNFTFCPKTELFDYYYGERASLLVTKFIPELRKFSLPADANSFEKICGEFETICNQLARLNAIHGDISDSNLMMKKSGALILTDFGIGKAPGSDKFKINYAAHDGTYFQTKGNARVYDDRYSFLRMLDDCGLPDNFRSLELYRKLVDEQGLFTYEIELPG